MTTRIMAAINVSPESFFSGSVARTAEEIAVAVRKAEEDGASMIDIGAMSTAPYKEAQISEAEEVARMTAAIRAARGATGLPVSADTQRAKVAKAALDAGATIINDVTALQGDPAIAALAASRGAVVVLMASEFADVDEQNETPINVVKKLLAEAVARALAAGIAREKIIVDPGIGFFRKRSLKWDEWDWAILRGVAELKSLGFPILIGASRKSFLGKIAGGAKAEDRLAGSLSVAAWCVQQGVDWLRVHDVRETSEVIKVVANLQRENYRREHREQRIDKE